MSDVRKIDREALREFCRRAAEIVRGWPAWKQNVFRDSSRAQWEKPRRPVDNLQDRKQ